MKRPSPRSQRGVALVITLIMLALIVVLVMAFLAVSTRERSAVADTGSQQDAVQMAQTALERAKAQIFFSLRTNSLGPDLAVSRSYPEYAPDQFLNEDAFLRVITNLAVDPRVPVFVDIGRPGLPSPLEFRYYVDLNRNAVPETNGLLPVLDPNGGPILDASGGVLTNFFVGDPEWVGVSTRANETHSANNRFFGRFAYLIQPVGRALDANFIHNQANLNLNMNLTSGAVGRNGFWRNQGVGSWEINQAAFLADLNTNVWNNTLDEPYVYLDNGFIPGGNGSRGWAFNDATDFLRFRYGTFVPGVGYVGDVRSLAPAEALLGLVAANTRTIFTHDFIDAYADGPLGPPTGPDDDRDDSTRPWCGSDSTNHFFSVHDLFDTNKCGAGFVSRLAYATGGTSSYDRYTLSRLMAQLATDSAPEPARADPDKLIRLLRARRTNDFPIGPVGKINLNYDNVGQSATNLWEWDPEKFFLTTANVLLRSQYSFGVTNIPVFPTNYYTPGVHRLLQIAANLVDATTNSLWPSVLRPQFGPDPDPNRPGGLVVSGYVLDNNALTATNNTYGVPFVIGAKKGLPNFNEYVQKTLVQAVSKVEVRRTQVDQPPSMTNEMFFLSITNFVGLELWNSYSSNHLVGLGNTFQVTVSNVIRTCLTNEAHPYSPANAPPWHTVSVLFTNLTYSVDPGWYFRGRKFMVGGFAVPVSTNVPILASMIYRPLLGQFELVGDNNLFTANNGQFITPAWGLCISNELTYMLSMNGRILDYVNLAHIDSYINITDQLMSQGDGPTDTGFNLGTLWSTNRVGNSGLATAPTEGVIRQIEVSLNPSLLSDEDWKNYNNDYDPVTGSDKFKGATTFANFLSTNYTNIDLARQAPFSPIRKFVQTTSLQANDPLVHYTVDDLLDRTNNVTPEFLRYVQPAFTNHGLTFLNDRYRPWGGNPKSEPESDLNESDVGLKDPGMWSSDFWEFPTNKFPNIGWVGRVHRGTPWQTIYLKAAVADPDKWAGVSLDPNTHPTNDWKLLDVFTTALHPNATRGQLSINQGGLAAWSAVLSGVMVLTNVEPTDLSLIATGPTNRSNLLPLPIEPGSPQLLRIVDGINLRQATNGPFRRLGDILSVPELSYRNPTEKSPYLSLNSDVDRLYGLTDLACERIPQQVLSLLKVGEPRFVIYAFGQALKPAPRSVMTAAGYFQVCTNYQVTAELYTRAVVRVEGTLADPRVVIESYNLLPTD